MSPDRNKGTSRSFLDNFQLLVTIGIAVLGAYMSMEQKAIDGKLNLMKGRLDELKFNAGQSSKLLDRAKLYTESLELDNKRKTRMFVSLFKLEKDMRIDDKEKVSELMNTLPYLLALLAGDSEALAHIGSTKRALDIWVPLAKTSGDIQTRRTAINALRNVAVLTSDSETLKMCVNTIVELTQRWNVQELNTEAIAAVSEIVKVKKRERDLPDDEVIRLLAETSAGLVAALEEIETTETQDYQEALAGRETTGDGSTTAPGAAGIVEPEPMIEAQVTGAEDPTAMAEAKPAPSGKRELLLARALKKSLEPELKAINDELSMDTLIVDLHSDDTQKRRLARSLIAEYGQQEIVKLLKILSDPSSSYRTRLGIVTALSIMDPAPSLKGQNPAPLIRMLGDRDKTIRWNTALFMGRLTDRESISQLQAALEAVSVKSDNFENPNLVYNSVVVLGDWLEYNPVISSDGDLRARIRKSLGKIKEALEKDYRAWQKTRDKIDEYLM